PRMISALRSWLPSSTKIASYERPVGSSAARISCHKRDRLSSSLYTGTTMDSSREQVTGTAPGIHSMVAPGRRGPLPLRDERLGWPQPVEHPRQGVRHQVVDLLGAIVKGRHWRQDDRPHFRERRKHAQVAQMERALTYHKN